MLLFDFIFVKFIKYFNFSYKLFSRCWYLGHSCCMLMFNIRQFSGANSNYGKIYSTKL